MGVRVPPLAPSAHPPGAIDRAATHRATTTRPTTVRRRPDAPPTRGSALTALDQIETWDVDAAAGVTSAAETLATHGPVGRRYPLASVTKLLTALAALTAVQAGRLGLDEPAGPEGSTVRHLLAHASGLPRRPGGPTSPVGARRTYSNVGYETLAEVVAAAVDRPFTAHLRRTVLDPLGLRDTTVQGSPAHGAQGTVVDLLAVGREWLRPTLVGPELHAEATTVAFPGLDGVLPGFGRQIPNDWGLGPELRDGKDPHWTGSANSPATLGHFGRSGTFLWVDPGAGIACAFLGDREFGAWATERWPALSDAVLAAHDGTAG